MTHESFDVPEHSAWGPQGEIEHAGVFARRIGRDRLRRAVTVAFAATLVLLAVALLIEFA